MCKLVEFKTNFGTICHVAEIKKEYIEYILKIASSCSDIDRIVLFGSSLEERCKDISDIDIAIFGNREERAFLQSKQFEMFERKLYEFGEFQDYDILYFQKNRINRSRILEDIEAGEVIYQREGNVAC